MADDNGIYGQWRLDDGESGGFHIWPGRQENETAEEAEEVTAKQLTLTN